MSWLLFPVLLTLFTAVRLGNDPLQLLQFLRSGVGSTKHAHDHLVNRSVKHSVEKA